MYKYQYVIAFSSYLKFLSNQQCKYEYSIIINENKSITETKLNLVSKFERNWKYRTLQEAQTCLFNWRALLNDTNTHITDTHTNWWTYITYIHWHRHTRTKTDTQQTHTGTHKKHACAHTQIYTYRNNDTNARRQTYIHRREGGEIL